MGTLHTRTNADSSREAVQSARGKLPGAKISAKCRTLISMKADDALNPEMPGVSQRLEQIEVRK